MIWILSNKLSPTLTNSHQSITKASPKHHQLSPTLTKASPTLTKASLEESVLPQSFCTNEIGICMVGFGVSPDASGGKTEGCY
jgi:hypothetical protein